MRSLNVLMILGVQPLFIDDPVSGQLDEEIHIQPESTMTLTARVCTAPTLIINFALASLHHQSPLDDLTSLLKVYYHANAADLYVVDIVFNNPVGGRNCQCSGFQEGIDRAIEL